MWVRVCVGACASTGNIRKIHTPVVCVHLNV